MYPAVEEEAAQSSPVQSSGWFQCGLGGGGGGSP